MNEKKPPSLNSFCWLSENSPGKKDIYSITSLFVLYSLVYTNIKSFIIYFENISGCESVYATAKHECSWISSDNSVTNIFHSCHYIAYMHNYIKLSITCVLCQLEAKYVSLLRTINSLKTRRSLRIKL